MLRPLKHYHSGLNIYTTNSSQINTPKEYLTEKNCLQIQDDMVKDYYNRLSNISQNNLRQKYVFGRPAHELPPINKQFNPFHLSCHQKQVKFDEKLKKRNEQSFESKRKKSEKNSDTDTKRNKRQVFLQKNEDRIREYLEKKKLDIRKEKLPKLIIKKIKDPFPQKYEPNYIDNIEKKFINPYLEEKSEFEIDYVENKASKIPLNFKFKL